MSGYTKLFNSILASTIWRADNVTRIVWITLLAMADRHGIAEGSIPGIADLARVSVKECRKAIGILAAPDEDSRSKEHAGRRIAAIDGGFQILNHAKYRARLSADERREYQRVKQAEYRKVRKQVSTNVINVGDTLTQFTHTEAEADTEAKEKAEETKSSKAGAPRPSTDRKASHKMLMKFAAESAQKLGTDATDADLRDHIKFALSRLHISYDGPDVARAIDAVRGQR